MEVAMEIGEISLLSIVTAVAPMALFVLLAIVAPHFNYIDNSLLL